MAFLSKGRRAETRDLSSDRVQNGREIMSAYRVNHPTIALVLENGHHVAHTVPTGSIITLENGRHLNGDRLMEVVWASVTVMMFTQDLRAYTTPMDGEEIILLLGTHNPSILGEKT